MHCTSLILRTNPLLTGNIKITVSDSGLYLDSIESNDKLSASKFKNVRINPNSYYAADVYNFFEKGQTPSNIIYDAQNIHSDKSITKDFSKQFEHRYNYGANRCIDKVYAEQYKIFAPLWLTRDIPKYFIIFKVPGAKHISYERNPEELIIGVNYRIVGGGTLVVNNNIEYANNFVAVNKKYKIVGDGYVVIDDPAYEISQKDIRKDFISKSQVVKVVSMKSGNLGQYLFNHTNDQLFNNNSIYTNFGEGNITYNGISIDSGIFVNKTINADYAIKNQPTIIDFDDYITRGYSQNRMISSNIMNLEFLFDDYQESYKFNRYFGLYCNDIDLSTFYLDTKTMFTDLYPNRYASLKSIPFNYGHDIVDEDGIKVIMNELSSSGYTPDYEKIKNNESFYYVKDKYNELMKVNNEASGDNIVLSRISINSEKLFGFNEHLELEAEAVTKQGKSSLEITVNNEVYVGYKISLYYKKTKIGFVLADTLANLNYAYGEGYSTYHYFYPYGTPEQIATALSGAIRYVLEKAAYATVKVSCVNNKIIVRSTSTGKDNLPISFNIHKDDEEISFSNQKMLGNAITKFSRIKVDSEFVTKMNSRSFLLTDQGYAKIKEITPHIDDLEYSPDGTIITNPDELGRYVSVVITDPDQRIILKNGRVNVYDTTPLTLGILSICDVVDFDTDFNSSSYSKSYTNEYAKYFDTDEDKLIIGETYYLFSTDDKPSNIEHDDVIYDSTPITGITEFIAVNNNFTKLTDNVVVINQKYYNDDELKVFVGFRTLQATTQNISVDNLEDKILKLSTDKTVTEYDRLKENVKSDNAVKSKIIPSINKWVLDDGKDIRDNEYRLNASLSFGKYNFSPSFIDDFQNPLYFTHEWLYLSNIPEAISLIDLKYQTAYFDKKFEVSKLTRTDEDYFSKYFTINSIFKHKGTNYNIIDVEPQQRYSTMKRIASNVFEAFFRGVRININSDTVDYDGYKFSSILNLNKTKVFSREFPYKITVVENREFKNITFVVDITIDEYKVLPILEERNYGEYLFLYVMNSLKRWNPTSLDYDLGLEFDLPDLESAINVEIHKDDGMGGSYKINSIRGTKIYNQVRYKYTSQQSHIEFNADKFPLNHYLKINAGGDYGKLYGWDEINALMITTDHRFTGNEWIIEEPSTIDKVFDNIVQTTPPYAANKGGLAIAYLPFYSTVGNFFPLAINGFYGLNLLYWFQEGGGLNYYNDLAKLLSFAATNSNIKEGIHVEYKLCKGDEIIDNNDVGLKFLEPDEVLKTSGYDVEDVDLLLPELPEENIKDYNYIDKSINEVLYRYSGFYRPKMNKILFFLDDNVEMVWSLYNKTWSSVDKLWKNPLSGEFISDKTLEELNEDRIPYSDILSSKNIKLDINHKNFGFISNFYIHKIGNPDIIKLKNPIYISNDEIAIAATNLEVFGSQWDAYYNKLFTNKSTSIDVYGTNNLIDTKSFFGTKILTLENEVLVDNYNKIKEDANISNVSYLMSDNDLVYEKTPERLNIRISHNKILKNYLYDNIKEEFIKYVNFFNTSFQNDDDAINFYINNNLLPAYRIDKIILYVKTHNDEEIEIINNEKNDLILLKNGYIRNKNFKSNEITNGETLLILTTNKELEYSVNVKFSLKII